MRVSMMTGCPRRGGFASAISWRSSTSSRWWFCVSEWKMPTSRGHVRLVEERRSRGPWPSSGRRPRGGRASASGRPSRDRAEAHGGHELAHFLGDEEEVVDDVLGLALEALAQHRVLRGDADGAGVEVALAHHDAASRDQRRGGEAELVGAEQCADDDVSAGAQAAVDLHRDARAQTVQHQRLVGLGEADFPRRAGMLDRGEGEAPVPPSKPEIVTWSARALATPAATVPTPTSETSFTEMSAAG
jgi:hypothetical protein